MLLPALLASFTYLQSAPVAPATPLAPSAATRSSDSGLYSLQSWPPAQAAEVPLDAEPKPASGKDRLLAYTRVRSAAFMGWSGSGLYIATRQGPHPQLHHVAAPLAPPRQATFFRRRADQWYLNPVPSKRTALIAFDQGGDEEFALSLLDLATGKMRGLPCPPGRVTGVIWNDSGTAFLYAHTPPGTGRWDIRLGRIASPAAGGVGGDRSLPARDTLVLSRPGTWIPMDWAPDGRSAVIQRHVSAAESELHVLSLERAGAGAGAGEASGPEATRLLPKEPAQYFDHAVHVRLPGTGRSFALAFTSDREGPNHRLYLLRPGEERPLALTPSSPYEVEWAAAGGDRRTLVFSRNEDGLSVLHALQPGRTPHQAVKLPGIPPGIIEGAVFHPSGREFAFTLNGSAFPAEAFTYRLSARKAVRWTESGTAGLPRKSFREPELVRYPTFDSVGGAPRMIPAWLYTPARAKGDPGSPAKSRKYPVLISIHGGPELQARGGFDPFVQYLVSRGVAVLLPNVRGSSGYGKDYLGLDDGFRRLDAVKDIGALLDWIAQRPDLDSRKVAVSGRSYGGFMALASLIRYGDRLAGGISSVGITHFPSFLRETSGYRRDLRRAEYGDERDPEMAAFLDSISPASRLDRLTRPLLLVHGRNDPRVPYGESVRLFEAMKERRVPAWLLTFNQEGHAVRSEGSQVVNARVMAEFIFRLF